MQYGKKKIPIAFLGFILIYLSYCLLFTPNFLVSIPVAFFPLFAYKLFWIDNKPNVLFWGMMMQWLSASTQLLYCNILQITLEEKMRDTSFPAEMMEYATLLSLVALYFFAAGMFIAIRKIIIENIEDCLSNYSPKKVLILYIVISIIIYLTSTLIWAFQAAVQYIYFFFYIKWGFFLITFYIIHKKAPLLRSYLYGFIGLEILLSFTSFFAGDFLNIASFMILAIVALQPKLNARSYIVIISSAALLVHMLILWTSVKGEYRNFVSAGVSGQSVNVSRGEANEKLFDLVSNVDGPKYQEGVEKFVDRLGYIQYFGASLDYVPRVVPYQNGQIYLGAVQHYLVPRFINPDKPILDDSKHTTEFTGIQVSGMEQATSFSLGYIADAYIDFGPFYMFPLLFAFGYLFGFFYKYLAGKSPNELWVWVLTGPFFLLININGTDTKKALGWILIYFLTVAIVRKQLIKRIDPFIRERIAL